MSEFKSFALALLIFLHPSSVFSATVTKVSDGFYTGQSTAPSGETIYFGMERVTTVNKSDFDSYFQVARYKFLDESRGIMGALATDCRDGVQGYDENLMKLTGFTKDEYNSFMQKLCEPERLDRKIQALTSLDSGFRYIHKNEGDFISYISTKPISKPLKFNINLDSTMKQFLQSTEDLVITVGSRIESEEKFSNRGVSKTANAVIYGGFSNVSMLLHGFTAAVFKEHFNKTQFEVRPVANMGRIIKNNVPKEEDWIEGYDRAGRSGDPQLIIKIDAVANFYLNRN